jgi:hypothetical protein
MAARAAVAPGDHRVAAEYVLDSHVMVDSTLRAHVRSARLLYLSSRQLASRFSGGHVERQEYHVHVRASSVPNPQLSACTPSAYQRTRAASENTLLALAERMKNVLKL